VEELLMLLSSWAASGNGASDLVLKAAQVRDDASRACMPPTHVISSWIPLLEFCKKEQEQARISCFRIRI
jgi:hypothetical protein